MQGLGNLCTRGAGHVVNALIEMSRHDDWAVRKVRIQTNTCVSVKMTCSLLEGMSDSLGEDSSAGGSASLAGSWPLGSPLRRTENLPGYRTVLAGRGLEGQEGCSASSGPGRGSFSRGLLVTCSYRLLREDAGSPSTVEPMI